MDFLTGKKTNKEASEWWIQHGDYDKWLAEHTDENGMIRTNGVVNPNAKPNNNVNVTQVNNFNSTSSAETTNNMDNAVQMLMNLTNNTSNGWS